jgi:hypothetical protein
MAIEAINGFDIIIYQSLTGGNGNTDWTRILNSDLIKWIIILIIIIILVTRL